MEGGVGEGAVMGMDEVKASTDGKGKETKHAVSGEARVKSELRGGPGPWKWRFALARPKAEMGRNESWITIKAAREITTRNSKSTKKGEGDLW